MTTTKAETEAPALGLREDFATLPDPRQQYKIDHLLIDIVTIAILAVVCGADDYPGIVEFGRDHEDWLKTFLTLPHGIPSSDTFRRVFTRIKPREFQRCFHRWVQRIATLTAGTVVPIDGKTLRRSHDRKHQQAAIELVSAWSSANQLSLGQVKVDADSNEITAVPELLRLLVLKGCIVTVDALNTQKETVAEIVRQEADYVCALKGNQGILHSAVIELFTAVAAGRTANVPGTTHQTVDAQHGRIETRRYWSVPAVEWLPDLADWPQLRSLCKVEATREVPGKEPTVTERYYISSLAPDAARLAEVTRTHWQIENSCHWRLDVAFREDHSRVRSEHAPENLGLIRRLALNLLQQEKSVKLGTHNKRLKAARNREYLLKVVNLQPLQQL